jgi:2,3,4,5-tetrahydropyridine-2-carboxylate N-succinyltransferase
MESLRSAIERLASLEVESNPDARQIFMDFRDELTQGKIRAAEKIDGQWIVNIWVKQGILLGFRLGELSKMGEDVSLSFVDKDTFPARRFTVRDRSISGRPINVSSSPSGFPATESDLASCPSLPITSTFTS